MLLLSNHLTPWQVTPDNAWRTTVTLTTFSLVMVLVTCRSLLPNSSSFTLAADSGSNDTFSTGGTLTFTGGEGIDTTVSDDTITIAAEDTVETNKGVATFDGTDFTVTSGDVTLNAMRRIQDIAGAMFSSNTETGVTATYQDSDGTIDLGCQ